MNTYKTRFFSTCPTNGVRIEYEVSIETDKVIQVEDIIDAVTLFNRSFHEEIADQLFREFGGRQTLMADHHGVTIRSIRP